MFGRKKAFQDGFQLGIQHGLRLHLAKGGIIYVDRDYCTPEIFERIRQFVIECCKDLPPANYHFDLPPRPPQEPGNFGGIRPL